MGERGQALWVMEPKERQNVCRLDKNPRAGGRCIPKKNQKKQNKNKDELHQNEITPQNEKNKNDKLPEKIKRH